MRSNLGGQSSANLKDVKSVALQFWQQAAHAHWHKVVGSSMWPFLLSGDSILIQPNTKQVRVGDVALLRFGERLLVHRITQINEDGSVIAWGDFNRNPDPAAEPEQIIGIAKKIRRRKRELSIGSGRRVWGKMVIDLRLLWMPCIRIVRGLGRVISLWMRFVP